MKHEKDPEPEPKQLNTIVLLFQSLGDSILKLDRGEISPKQAHAKAHLAGKMIQCGVLVLNYQRTRNQGQVKRDIRMISDASEDTKND
jgi:hypothetical protein